MVALLSQKGPEIRTGLMRDGMDVGPLRFSLLVSVLMLLRSPSPPDMSLSSLPTTSTARSVTIRLYGLTTCAFHALTMGIKSLIFLLGLEKSSQGHCSGETHLR